MVKVLIIRFDIDLRVGINQRQYGKNDNTDSRHDSKRKRMQYIDYFLYIDYIRNLIVIRERPFIEYDQHDKTSTNGYISNIEYRFKECKIFTS